MSPEIVEEIARHCVLTRTRLIARTVTAIYDDALRPFGIQASQFALLVIIAKLGPARRAEIGRINQQDRSTLTRNLRIMLREGWIEEVPGRDGKGRLVQAAAPGARLLAEALAPWRAAQARANALLGEVGAATLTDIGNRLLFGAAA
ncbi:MarR family winged helix-turn-helix transcriptional regulator [Methylobacterium sp. JK268]